MTQKFKRRITLVLVIFSVVLTGVSVFLAYYISNVSNVNPTQTSAQASTVTSWVKVKSLTNGSNLGVVQNKLVVLSIDPSGAVRLDTSSNGTIWDATKNVASLYPGTNLNEIREFNGKIVVGAGPLSGEYLIGLDGKYYAVDRTGYPSETSNADSSFDVNSSGNFSAAYPIGQMTIAAPFAPYPGQNLPPGPKLIMSYQTESNNRSFLGLFPGRQQSVQTLYEYDKGGKENFAQGIVVGKTMFVATNYYQQGGTIKKYTIQDPVLSSNNPTWGQTDLPSVPNAFVTRMNYDSNKQRIYVTGFVPGSGTGGRGIIYSLDVNGNLKSQYTNFLDGNGNIPRAARVYNNQLYVTINHEFAEGTHAGPGYMVCDLNGTGDITTCGNITKFEGIKVADTAYMGLELFNNALYAVTPLAVYKLTETTITDAPTATQTAEPTATTTQTAEPTATATQTDVPTATATTEPIATTSTAPTTTISVAATATATTTTSVTATITATTTATAAPTTANNSGITLNAATSFPPGSIPLTGITAANQVVEITVYSGTNVIGSGTVTSDANGNFTYNIQIDTVGNYSYVARKVLGSGSFGTYTAPRAFSVSTLPNTDASNTLITLMVGISGLFAICVGAYTVSREKRKL